MWPAILLTLLVTVYRVVSGILGATDHQWLHNFSPVAAVVLCGAVYFPKRYALLLPLGAVFVSDVVLNLWYGLAPVVSHMLFTYPALLLVAGLGWALRARPQVLTMLAASLVGSVLFYVITNTGSWLGNSSYPQNASGWVQALTTGLPGFPPTWTFFRNTAVSDLFFTLLFLACVSFSHARRETPAAKPALA